jgi:hypothetical protein
MNLDNIKIYILLVIIILGVSVMGYYIYDMCINMQNTINSLLLDDLNESEKSGYSFTESQLHATFAKHLSDQVSRSDASDQGDILEMDNEEISSQVDEVDV